VDVPLATCRKRGALPDHFFTGFPSYWNIVVFYLVIARLPATMNAAILLALAVLVFVPIRYLYPSRTPVLMWPTNILGAIWGVLMVVMLWQYPAISRPVFLASLTVAAVPAGSVVSLLPAFTATGLPISGLSILIGLDRIPDMFRTMTNVTGHLTGAVVIPALEGEPRE